MAKLFGFVQFDFAGKLPLADGRYLADGEETVLVVKRLGTAAVPSRRRRRGRGAPADPEPGPVSLTRVTVIRASAPLAGQTEAARWLDAACEAEDTVEVLAEEAIAPLNRALHAHAVAAADPRGRELAPEAAERVLIGYGSGEETAAGRFADARQFDLSHQPASRRRRREEELRPQERMAGVLRGRDRLDVCETLLLRARADLDSGREREAALQLRVGLEALLVELDGALDDTGHEKDMATLRASRASAVDAATAAIAGPLAAEERGQVEGLLVTCERVLRRRRVLAGS
ncbi:MAG TPA: hypothetical protein VFL77_00710 [Solirubrobacterales bacterium]|nr:hypothetical protein [Solirubrobacterales bacterium]